MTPQENLQTTAKEIMKTIVIETTLTIDHKTILRINHIKTIIVIDSETRFRKGQKISKPNKTYSKSFKKLEAQ